jgi:aspartate/methionine/tyrosine aminotransferase
MKVAVAPGQAFGEVAHNHVRVSLAAEEDALVEGLGRMRQFIENNAQD